MQLPSFIEEVSKNKKLLYFKVSGLSDNTSQEFSAIYSKENKTIFRNLYPQNYKEQLTNKLNRFKMKLKDKSSDKVKLNFLIERINDKQKQYNKDNKYSKSINSKYKKILDSKSSYLDFTNSLLLLSLKTSNKNGGRVSLLFDISEISELKSKVINDLLIETSIALLLSIFVLLVLSSKIIGPLNKLSIYISDDLKSLNTNNVPGLELKNEIGILSRSFKVLLQTEQQKQMKIEKKAYFDTLTGIYNRNKFDDILNEELKRVQRYSNKLSMAIIDIDKFKNINDTYGHLIGDEVLVMISKNISSTIRITDIFARWGGEEFVVLFKETSIQDAQMISKKIKDAIQNVEHPLAGSITISLGVTKYLEGDTLESIFKRCDDALYLAKENGRNRIKIL